MKRLYENQMDQSNILNEIVAITNISRGLRTLLKQMKHDTILIREYLNIHSAGKFTPNIIDPVLLRRELITINKQLPQQLALPENPRINIWHYSKFLTVPSEA